MLESSAECLDMMSKLLSYALLLQANSHFFTSLVFNSLCEHSILQTRGLYQKMFGQSNMCRNKEWSLREVTVTSDKAANIVKAITIQLGTCFISNAQLTYWHN